jgi:hypothetical protein
MTALTVPLSYPLAAADGPRAVERTAVAVSMLRATLSRHYSREWLETTLRRYLREGGLSITIKAAEAADAGDEIADAALREVGAELQMALLQGRTLAPGHVQVIAYLQRAARRAAPKRKPGRYAWYDDWFRNLSLCFLVLLTCAEYGVLPTRNRQSRRSGQRPSGISIVTAALARNQIHLDEGTIQQKIWFGLPGELARQLAAERPIATWFRPVSP